MNGLVGGKAPGYAGAWMPVDFTWCTQLDFWYPSLTVPSDATVYCRDKLLSSIAPMAFVSPLKEPQRYIQVVRARNNVTTSSKPAAAFRLYSCVMTTSPLTFNLTYVRAADEARVTHTRGPVLRWRQRTSTEDHGRPEQSWDHSIFREKHAAQRSGTEALDVFAHYRRRNRSDCGIRVQYTVFIGSVEPVYTYISPTMTLISGDRQRFTRDDSVSSLGTMTNSQSNEPLVVGKAPVVPDALGVPDADVVHPRSNVADVSGGVGDDAGGTCGWGCLRPRWLQRFRTPPWVLFFLCWAGFLQGLIVNGFVNVVITTIERRFQLRSSESGLVASGYDIASFLLLAPISYFGGTRSKPLFVGVGCLVLGLGALVFSMPHFLAGTYAFSTEDDS
ncbi:hypothetical protein HPB49_006911 [Dermacentor silvarum]|uniref:Uncharacterized protein n=1 Tax=Dermacentor silvarum TaxID=543639 RepID=A0ACB8CW02_DERSI|nr:hypothetical protein HPB49_006911 [Dermacentor silvarum]